ncbi:MAG: hypothetical protein M1488_06465 [Gammaproteobacteria bacterium]|nr:hypothetical protein [Gammaproteobacteria bacterium]
MQWHVISHYIIDMTLGVDWFDSHCQLGENRLAPFAQDLSTDSGAAEFHLNVVRLAHMLFQLRDTPGYDDFISSLMTRDFEPVFFELHAASLLFQNSCTVQFVKTTGIKGQDYDLRLLIENKPVAVEVKSRRASPITDRKKLKNALSEARKQLPTDIPGIVCVAISAEFHTSPEFAHAESEVEVALTEFLNSTKRVNRVLVFWHRFEGEPVHSKTMIKEWKNLNARLQIDREWLIAGVNELPIQEAVQNGFPSFMQLA